MASLFLLWVCLLFVLNDGNRGEWGQIKINEPRNNYQAGNSYSGGSNDNNQGSGSSSSSSSTSYRDPHSETENSDIVAPSILEYFTERKGETVEGTHDKYTYKVEIFQKVEQSENWYSWNLGIFDKWDYCDSTQNELCLVFNDGQVCGNGVGRAAFVHIVCDIGDKDPEKEHLYDISEPLTCVYHMNMYIPRVCEILNNDVSNAFVANNPDGVIPVQESQDDDSDTVNLVDDANITTETIGNVGIIGGGSALMSKLNDIIDAQNDNQELDHLWKLCLMSLMVDDEGKLNKIKTVANMYMLKGQDINVGAIGDIDTSETEICDFYLDQMVNSKQNAQKKKLSKKSKATDPPLPPADDNSNSIDAAVVTEESTNDKEDVSEGSDKMGGLIGQAMMEKDNEDEQSDVDSDASKGSDDDIDVDVQEFKGDKVVFQSGNSEKIADIEVNVVADEEEEEEQEEEDEEEQEEIGDDTETEQSEEEPSEDMQEQEEEEEEEEADVPDVPEARPAHSDM